MKVKVLVLFFVLAIIFSSCGNNKPAVVSQTADTLAKAAAPAPDYGMMIVANVSVKPEKVKAFTEAAKEIIENTHKEAGCRFYQLYQDPYESTKFVFVEQYDNQAAVDAHFAADYFKAFGPKIADLVTEPAKIKIVSVAKEVNQ
jgi:quinol monooxygenase YgiN